MENIGRYEIRAELGRGGMGVVYRAYDPELDREVAVKSVRIEGVDAEQRRVSEQYLAREARAAAKLQHPNAVAVHDFFTVEDRAYIVMEFIRGANLEAMIASGSAGDRGKTLQILREAASALDAAHHAGIVHRDVKPANILLDATGRVKIADFGIARVTTPGQTVTAPSMGATAGTLSYMSPEQIRGDKLDGRSDQFALAVVAYQMLTGQLPFQAETWIAQSFKILNDPPAPPVEANPSLTPAINAALLKALSKNADDRFPTCSAFVEALHGAAIVAAPASRGNRNLLILAGIAAVVLVGFVLYFRGVKSTIEAPRKEESAKETKTETKTAEPAPKQEVTPPAQPESESLALILDGIPMDFAAVQPGRFVMGLNVGRDDQKPEHMVEITKKFQIGRTEVTEKHWNAVMSGKATGSDKPKVNVSYLDAQAFLARLNGRNDGWRYRLPTEAEWEYCARAGDPREMPRDLDAQAWTGANSGYQLRDVASEKMPNLWGIYGMLGNASEWTQDWLDAEYYSKSPARDPQGPATGEARIFRGGNANMDQTTCNYYWRFATLPTDKTEWIGFRVVRERKP